MISLKSPAVDSGVYFEGKYDCVSWGEGTCPFNCSQPKLKTVGAVGRRAKSIYR
jgi:hypothetical protein